MKCKRDGCGVTMKRLMTSFDGVNYVKTIWYWCPVCKYTTSSSRKQKRKNETNKDRRLEGK